MMRRAIPIAVLFLVVGLATHVRAGSLYEISCSDEKCGFKVSLGIGGGFTFMEAAGFCKKCNGPVSLRWDRNAKDKEPVAEFWDPGTGEVRKVYRCPDCAQPFVVIEKIEGFKFCPKCGKATLKHKRKLMYD